MDCWFPGSLNAAQSSTGHAAARLVLGGLTGRDDCEHAKSALPQLDGGLFLTDGGIETDLIFNDGFELPYFAAFHLLQTEKGTAALRAYFARYAAIARNGTGFILESPTWRASADWGDKLGYSSRRWRRPMPSRSR